jgi:hypothetical protein
MLSERIQFVICAVLLSTSWITSRAQNVEVQQLPPQTAREQPGASASRLAELPPGPVIVNYQDGQLIIEAQNATLSSVLRAACNQTGTVVDIPSDAEERVVGVFGPGPAREVFASLLNGSLFNYVMMGSTDAAARVVRLTLSVRRVSERLVSAQETRSAQPVPRPVAKVLEVPPVPQVPQQAEKPLAEMNAQDHSALKELRRRHRR